MKEPLVSVITPCYNSAGYIGRYLDCILAQDYDNIQLIIINDGSKDATEEIVKSYVVSLEEKGVTLTYSYQQNQGLGAAINAGLKLIKGEYFTWCDSDNLLTNDYFRENIAFFEAHPEAMIVRCDGYNVLDRDIYNPLSRMSDGVTNKYEKKLFLPCLTAKDFYFGCTMLRTSAFDSVNPQREIYPSREGQNWQIMLPMFYKYDSYYIDKPMFYFVIREDSISHAAAHKGFEAIIKQNNACEELEATVIKGMGIPEEKEYLNIVYRQYSYIRFWIADQYGKTLTLKAEYHKIKENGWLTDEIYDVHRRWMNPLWRIAHKLKAKGWKRLT